MTRSWFTSVDAPVRVPANTGAWKSVLVPLDGSEMLTRVLESACYILQHPRIDVSYLRVIECSEERANDLSYQANVRHRGVTDSLKMIRNRFGNESAAVNAELRFGDPAVEILREIEEGNHDLVIMSPSVRGGRGNTSFARAARKVLRSSAAPLLHLPMRVRNGERFGFSETFQRILVALDGSEGAEEIIPSAERMARTLDSELYLFRAVPPGVREAVRRRVAEEYLAEWRGRLISRGIRTRAEVRTGPVVEAAIDLMIARDLDSIALTTHARQGLGRAVRGNVAHDLMRDAAVPILSLCSGRRRRPVPAPALQHRHLRIE